MTVDHHLLCVRRITDVRDPCLPDWLDLFQVKFPIPEQVQASVFLRSLANDNSPIRLIAVLQEDTLVGMACYELKEDAGALYLWYLAAEPEGQGIGSWIYRCLETLAVEELPLARAIVFEVERPEDTHDEVTCARAERRIAFYRRLGARLCEGVSYTQDVGWQPPMPMHLMVQPIEPDTISTDETRRILEAVFGDAVTGLEGRILT
jgi:hypothetical protein